MIFIPDVAWYIAVLASSFIFLKCLPFLLSRVGYYVHKIISALIRVFGTLYVKEFRLKEISFFPFLVEDFYLATNTRKNAPSVIVSLGSFGINIALTEWIQNSFSTNLLTIKLVDFKIQIFNFGFHHVLDPPKDREASSIKL